MKKKVILVLLVQVLAWVLFTLCDAHDEATGETIIWYVVFWAPCLICVLYFALHRFVYRPEPCTWKGLFRLCMVWILAALVIGFIITISTCMLNCYFVHQETDGWENFLNGIEYPIFGFILGIVPALVAFLGEGLLAIIRTVREEL